MRRAAWAAAEEERIREAEMEMAARAAEAEAMEAAYAVEVAEEQSHAATIVQASIRGRQGRLKAAEKEREVARMEVARSMRHSRRRRPRRLRWRRRRRRRQ